MKSLKLFLTHTLILLCSLFTTSCFGSDDSSEIVFVGSTPGDELIKSILTIPSDTKVDFIMWNLRLNTTNANQNSFLLDIILGEAQPNTRGFKGGGEKYSFKGTYTVSKSWDNNISKEVYHLKSSKLPTEIVMIKINDNIFHLLTPQNQLMIGNGGWSYTLNRKDPINSTGLISMANYSSIVNDTSLQVVFDGRTPCQEISAEHPEMKASQSCFKLKWRLILNRDSISHFPTTYTIRKVVDNEPGDISGKWTIIKGTALNPDVIIYQIEPDKPEESISFLVGDNNVLFFLKKNNALYVGNEDHSYTLNKKIQ